MTFAARKPENKASEQPQAGTHVGRLLSITDLGHQPGFVYDGKKIESAWKLEFTYELVNHFMEDGRPFVISEDLTNKDWEDAKSGRASTLVMRAKSLLNERYREGVEEITTLLTQPCMITVTHNEKGYAKIRGQAAVGSVPFGMETKELRNPAVTFQMDNPDMDLWSAMPEFKQNKIMAALNFNETELFKIVALDGEL